MEQEQEKALIEVLAALEHDRWSRWHRYCMANLDEDHIERWDRQAETKYEFLSETEKESDRKEARLTIEAIKNAPHLVTCFIRNP